MIAHRVAKRGPVRDSFGRLVDYVANDRVGSSDEREAPRDSYENVAGYVLDIGSGVDLAGEPRFDAYDPNDKRQGDRVVGARITNCGTDNIADAVLAIQAVQSLNTRSRTDKTYHMIVSFPEGERPTSAQLIDIEDQLCAAIGLGDHQRISAIHDDTDNLHIHIAINKVHPETLRNVEPYFDQPKLMAKCIELEEQHGLKRDHHGQKAEKESGRNFEPDNARDGDVNDAGRRMEEHSGQETLQRWIAEHAREDLVSLAASATTWSEVHAGFAAHGLVIRARGAGLVIGSPKQKVFVKASSVDPALAFKPMIARFGDYEPPARERADRREESGRADRPDRSTQERAAGYRRSPRQAQQMAKALYARYEAQRGAAESQRTQAMADYGQRHAAYATKLTAHYRERRAIITNNRALRGAARVKARQDLEIERIKDFTSHQANGRTQRAAITRAFPRVGWQSFLEAEAARGDEAAVAALRSRVVQKSPVGADILTAADREAARHVVYQQLMPAANKSGDLTYRLKDGGVVTDRAGDVRADTVTVSSAFLALSLAADRFVGQPLDVQGSDAFKATIIEVAALKGFDVTFADAGMERGRQAAVALHAHDLQMDMAPEMGAAAAYVANRNGLRDRVADVPAHRLWNPADAGPAEYAGRRAFKDGTEAVLLKVGGEVQVLPVTMRQAAKASRWSVGDLVVTDDRGRFLNTAREQPRGERDGGR